jgi:hypothetical protein
MRTAVLIAFSQQPFLVLKSMILTSIMHTHENDIK